MVHAALLAAALATPTPALPARPPDATYTYTLFLGGARTGSSAVSIDGTAAGALVLKETADYTAPKVHATTTLRFDPATLHQTDYSGDFTIAAGSRHTDAVVTPGVVAVRVPGNAVDIAADPSAPLEVISDNLIAASLLVPALVDATDLRAYTLAVLSTGTALVVKIGRDPGATRPANLAASDKLVSLQFGGLIENIWYDPATFVVTDVTVPAQQAEFRLTATTPAGSAPPTPPPAILALPTPAPHFTSTEVRFTSADGTVLAGTLTIPNGRASPRATVVLVHGSGAEDRDETIGPNAVFLQLSNALSNAGYVVLRYDKRNVGKSGGAPYSGTREKLLDDVAAALRFARASSSVDTKRIFVLGHSEGGELVPSVAVRDPGVAGIVLMAPPARPLWQVLYRQTLASHPEVPASRYERAALAEYARIRTSNEPADAWLRSSIDVDPTVDIARVRVPILILQGRGDAQVLAKDLPRLVTAARAHNARVTVRTFANDNHLFEAVVGSAQTPVQALNQYLTVPARIDRRVLDALTGWLATSVRAPSSRPPAAPDR
jgi:alpha-beta hydrolase superfamily lysophospholipase